MRKMMMTMLTMMTVMATNMTKMRKMTNFSLRLLEVCAETPGGETLVGRKTDNVKIGSLEVEQFRNISGTLQVQVQYLGDDGNVTPPADLAQEGGVGLKQL